MFEEYNEAQVEVSHLAKEASHLVTTPGIVDELNATVANMFENATALFSANNHHGNSSEYELSPLEEKGYELYMQEGPQQCDAQAFALTDKVVKTTLQRNISFHAIDSFLVGLQYSNHDLLLRVSYSSTANLRRTKKVNFVELSSS